MYVRASQKSAGLGRWFRSQDPYGAWTCEHAECLGLPRAGHRGVWPCAHVCPEATTLAQEQCFGRAHVAITSLPGSLPQRFTTTRFAP